MTHEHEIRGIAGWPMVFLLAAMVLAASAGLVMAAREAMVEGVLLSALVIAIACVCFAGLTVVNPNQAKVVTLFGVYKGSIKVPDPDLAEDSVCTTKQECAGQIQVEITAARLGQMKAGVTSTSHISANRIVYTLVGTLYTPKPLRQRLLK